MCELFGLWLWGDDWRKLEEGTDRFHWALA